MTPSHRVDIQDPGRRDNDSIATNTQGEGEVVNTQNAAAASPVAPGPFIQLDDDSTSIEVIKPSPEEEPLQQELLEVLGERLEEEIIYALPICKDITVRWIDIIRKGLPKVALDPILKKYNPPENCKEILPPKLNPEVKASVPDSAIKRDERIFEKQRKISSCLGALGKSLSIVVKADFPEKVLLFEHLNNLGKFLSDLQHGESLVRKTLIQTNLNESFRDMLSATEPDDWLFGNSLEENIKLAKSLERSSKDLKVGSKAPTSKTSKNGKGPQRQQQARVQKSSNAQKPASRPSNYQAGQQYKKNIPPKTSSSQKRRY